MVLVRGFGMLFLSGFVLVLLRSRSPRLFLVPKFYLGTHIDVGLAVLLASPMGWFFRLAAMAWVFRYSRRGVFRSLAAGYVSAPSMRASSFLLR